MYIECVSPLPTEHCLPADARIRFCRRYPSEREIAPSDKYQEYAARWTLQAVGISIHQLTLHKWRTRRAVWSDVYCPAIIMNKHVGTVAELVVYLEVIRRENGIVYHHFLAQIDRALSRPAR